MQLIPLQAFPSQSLSSVLGDQFVQLAIRQTRYGLFMDVYSSGVLVIGGVICENLNRIVRSKYLGFSGDFVFYDTRGTQDPDFSGLGTDGRFKLYYLTDAEIAEVLAA